MKTKLLPIKKHIRLGLFLYATFACGLQVQAQPVITNQPVSITTNAGVTVVFAAGASGTAGYRWYFSGTNVPVAATGPGNFSRLTLRSITSSQAGDYYVVATNGANSATSSIATLTLNTGAPTITHEPADVTANMGASANLFVSASGSTPFSYQWWFSGNAVPGGKGQNLYFTHIQTNQAGGYYVIITNDLGAATSRVATVTVNLAGGPGATNSPSLTIVRHSSSIGDVLLLTLDVGNAYRIQSSPDMAAWSDIYAIYSYFSVNYFTNSAATNQILYYRLVSP